MSSEAIQDTLERRFDIKLSEKELLEFSNYLVALDPYYPAWSELGWYIDRERESQGKTPWQYRIVKNGERFYKAFENFKQKSREAYSHRITATTSFKSAWQLQVAKGSGAGGSFMTDGGIAPLFTMLHPEFPQWPSLGVGARW